MQELYLLVKIICHVLANQGNYATIGHWTGPIQCTLQDEVKILVGLGPPLAGQSELPGIIQLHQPIAWKSDKTTTTQSIVCVRRGKGVGIKLLMPHLALPRDFTLFSFLPVHFVPTFTYLGGGGGILLICAPAGESKLTGTIPLDQPIAGQSTGTIQLR
jgi:hypothetical protein